MKKKFIILAILAPLFSGVLNGQTSTRGRPSLLNRNRTILFAETNRMPYSVAVEKAKTSNDAEAYYWLSYYFAKGEEVEANGVAAWRFLGKSNSFGFPYAKRAMAYLYEAKLFKPDTYIGGYVFDVPAPIQIKAGCSFTNQTATAFLESLYREAIDRGVSTGTNDIARLHQKITDAWKHDKEDRARKQAQIVKAEKTETALSLVFSEEEMKREAERAAEKAEREKEREEQRAQLMQIREELKKAREEATAKKAKE